MAVGQQHLSELQLAFTFIGSTLCQPHTWHRAQRDGTTTYGLSCRWSKRQHHFHAAVNYIVHLLSRLEPTGLFCSDGKQPDGITLVPWRSCRLLVWDATCPLCSFRPTQCTSEAGAVAALAERSKHEKYLDLNQCHTFTPVAIKTAGHFEPETFLFLRELGCRLKQVTGEAKSFSYLQHHLSIAVQRENAPAVMGSMGGGGGGTISPFDYLVFFLGAHAPPPPPFI